ncbi:hypothetical protein EXIGLDRAFT_730915 [Exidia glandulosa HHB12029]|uniref:BTB domain-containing protein n=1 Tax=Exidia glandulosa HHB12029 TaxID=1314781 RepID=A0A165PXQ5_EXIGL|nr:hypothetical protein EXIGLDRAFT_730915 [Exidia glandulosa HHB12029]
MASLLATLRKALDIPDADIVLRSSDQQLFKANRQALAYHSAVFRDMFSLAGHDGHEEMVDMSESATCLAVILTMCYPLDEPPVDFATLEADLVLECYEAAGKYGMWVAGLALRNCVEPLIKTEPFLVARTAHRLRDRVLLLAAGRELLKRNILVDAEENGRKAGVGLWANLLVFYFKSKEEVVKELSSLPRAPRPGGPYSSHPCRCNDAEDAWLALRATLERRLPTASLPKGELVTFLETQLTLSISYGCSQCPRAWRDLRTRVEEYESPVPLLL